MNPFEKSWLSNAKLKAARVPKQDAAEMGKTFNKSLKRFRNFVNEPSSIPDKKEQMKIKEAIARIGQGIGIIKHYVTDTEKRKVATFPEALKIIDQNQNLYRDPISGFLGIDINMFRDLYNKGVVNKLLVNQAYEAQEV